MRTEQILYNAHLQGLLDDSLLVEEFDGTYTFTKSYVKMSFQHAARLGAKLLAEAHEARENGRLPYDIAFDGTVRFVRAGVDFIW